MFPGNPNEVFPFFFRDYPCFSCFGHVSARAYPVVVATTAWSMSHLRGMDVCAYMCACVCVRVCVCLCMGMSDVHGFAGLWKQETQECVQCFPLDI